MCTLIFGQVSDSMDTSGWLKLIRVPAEGIPGVLLSTNIVRSAVHWADRQSVPCVGKDCPGCALARPRPYGFVGFGEVFEGKMFRAVLEVPGSAADELEQFTRDEGQQGAATSLVLSRARGQKKGRVGVMSNCEEIETSLTVELWEIWRTLAAVWSFPRLPTADTNMVTWLPDAVNVARRRLQVAFGS